jgi:protocatechuate 3,4-dioxygenase beta subunit
LRPEDPPLDWPKYESTRLRAPKQPLVVLPERLADLREPVFGHSDLQVSDCDLTRQHSGTPIGERVVVTGRVTDSDGRPVRRTLVEVWQANAAGRYRHAADTHDAPLDPNFSGAGRGLTDEDGRYEFVTIKPGAYPWRNGGDAWRPAHVHFSVFGRSIWERLVTQMYFPGDPLLASDAIYNSVPQSARHLLVASVSPTHPAITYRFDIVL